MLSDMITNLDRMPQVPLHPPVLHLVSHFWFQILDKRC